MHLIVPYLLPPEHFLQVAAQDLRLPALETMIARGRRDSSSPVGLEGALCRAWGIDRQSDWPWAALSLGADGGTAEQSYWLRTDPVHIRIQRDRPIVLGSDLLDLQPEEAAALCADLHVYFGEAFHPLPLQPDRWYWRMEQDPQMNTTPLSLAVGRPIDTLLPHGPDAMKWRTLLNEIQMLLFNHPINQQREARNLPMINSVWLWGGGHASPVASVLNRFYCPDGHLRSVAQQLGMLTPPWTGQPDELDSDALVLLNQLQPFGQYGDILGWRAAAKELDEMWLARLIRSGVAMRLEDPVTGNSLDFNPRDRWKFWRRLKPLAVPGETLALSQPPATANVDEFGNVLGK
ncbi:MAG: hypothetical protein WCA45_14000 [Thiobacillaceae bacterium]